MNINSFGGDKRGNNRFMIDNIQVRVRRICHLK